MRFDNLLRVYNEAPDEEFGQCLQRVGEEASRQLLKRMASRDRALTSDVLGKAIYETFDIFDDPLPWDLLTPEARGWWCNLANLAAHFVRTYDRGELVEELGMETECEEAESRSKPYRPPSLVKAEGGDDAEQKTGDTNVS